MLHDSELPLGYTFMSRRAPVQSDGLCQQFRMQPCGSSLRAWARKEADAKATVIPDAATLAALHSVASMIAVSPAAAHDDPDVRTTKSDDDTESTLVARSTTVACEEEEENMLLRPSAGATRNAAAMSIVGLEGWGGGGGGEKVDTVSKACVRIAVGFP